MAPGVSVGSGIPPHSLLKPWAWLGMGVCHIWGCETPVAEKGSPSHDRPCSEASPTAIVHVSPLPFTSWSHSIRLGVCPLPLVGVGWWGRVTPTIGSSTYLRLMFKSL